MAPSPCPDCGHSLLRSRRRWHERWRIRVVKRCTNCGLRVAYPLHPGERYARYRMVRIGLLALLFVTLVLAGPAVIITLMAPEAATSSTVD